MQICWQDNCRKAFGFPVGNGKFLKEISHFLKEIWGFLREVWRRNYDYFSNHHTVDFIGIFLNGTPVGGKRLLPLSQASFVSPDNRMDK
jgi:hypothetical protein